MVNFLEQAHSQQSSRMTTFAWLMWSVAAFFYAYEFCLKLSLTVMTKELMRDFAVDAKTLGILSSMYFFAYAIMQIPVGILMDRFGTRRLLTTAAMTVSLGCAVFASADDLYLAGFGRFLMGAGSAFAFVGCLKVSATWFPANRFAMIVGLTNMLGVFGVISGEAPLSLLVQHVGWREAILGAAALGLMSAALIYLVIRDHSEISAQPQQGISTQSLLKGVKTIIRSPQTWLVALYGCLMVAPIVGFVEQWSVVFIQDVFPAMSKTEASLLSMMVFVGIGIGGLVHGTLSSYWGQRKPVMSIGALGALVFMLLILYFPLYSRISMGMALFALGFFSSSMLLGFAVNSEINPTRMRGTVIGFTNMMVMAGGAFFQPLIGRLLDASWNSVMIDGARHFSLHNFHTALSILPICQVVAFIIIFFIDETYCEQQVE